MNSHYVDWYTVLLSCFCGLRPLTTFLPTLLILEEFLWTSFPSVSWVNLPQTEHHRE
jgi:hypothetical protein